jgi:phage terminase Nu1 subunit (DNA packaging protein)
MSTDTKRPLLLTASELLELLPVGPDTLARWVAEGLPCLWSGGRPGVGVRLFRLNLVEDWIDGRTLGTAKTGEGEDGTPPKPGRRGKAAKRVGGKYQI